MKLTRISDALTNALSRLDSRRWDEIWFDPFNFGGGFSSVSHREDDFNYYLEVNLPGFKKEEVSVNINADNVVVEGKNKRGNFYREYHISTWRFADLDKGTAKLEDGVLTVTLPKSESEREKGRIIKVE